MSEVSADAMANNNTDAGAEDTTGVLLDQSGEQNIQSSTQNNVDGTKQVIEFAIPDSFKDNPRFEGVDSVDSMAAKLAGMPDAVVIPENSADYDIPDVQGLSTEEMTVFRDGIHKAGFSEDQANMIINYNNQRQVDHVANENQLIQNGLKNLRTDWGTSFDTNVKEANIAVKMFDTEDGAIGKLLKANPTMGNHPEVLKFFHRINQAVAEDTLIDSDGRLGKKKANDGEGNTVLGTYEKSMG